MTAPSTTQAAQVLTTRIGRRMITMFAVCALLPLAAFAWVALAQTSEVLNRAAERDLHQTAKNAGMNLAARLVGLDADMELARAMLLESSLPGDLARNELANKLRMRFESLCVITAGAVQPVFGRWRGDPAPLQPREAEHLTTGKSLLRVQVQPRGEPIVTLLRNLEPNGLLAAEVNNSYLFDPEDLRASGAEVLVFDSAGAFVFGTVDPPPDIDTLTAAVHQQPASGTIAWKIADEPHMGHYWRLFLRPQFGCDLLLVQSRASAQVLAPLHGFQWLFAWTTVLTLLFVLIAALAQIRRMLTPITDLQQATQRVAGGDLTTPVASQSKDEFGALAQSFNSMTGQLRENIRRREATELQLVAARDEALAAARAKADFLTNVSHELRTPLTSIVVYAELLTSFTEDETQRTEFLAVIAEQANHLNGLVEKVLDLSTASRWELLPTDVGETVRAAIATMPPAARGRITLATASVPRIAGAHDRLVQLWSYLLDNAVKFSPKDSAIEVDVAADGDQVTVAVMDHGAGIAATDLQRIFEPFCQVGRDIMTQKSAGVGLGLTLAHNIVDRHGGRIDVHSTLGAGSTFRVLLPTARIQAAADAMALTAT